MEFVADLHLHSKYSRAVSRDMNLFNMDLWASKKGLDILSASDWTHPLWFREIQKELTEDTKGLFKLKGNKNSKTRFLLSVEVSSIYSQGGKVRRIHNLIWSPSFETCEKINKELIKRGCNLSSDGRPIIGLSSIQLIELVLSIDKEALIIPCHAWTPWFSLYGSNSGFDSIEECFGDYAKYIYAVETGLSSDPYMNWQIKELDEKSILSFSDAHSMAKMGREATIFKTDKKKISYIDIVSAIKRERKGTEIFYTVEFYPEEGKYHFTGHRNCNFVQTPGQTKENGSICPVCKRPLTVGVMHRVEELARNPKFSTEISKINPNGVKWIVDPDKKHPPFVKLVPLNEIIAESLSSTVASEKVKSLFNDLCKEFGSELNVLLKTEVKDIEKFAGPRLAEGIEKVRKGNIVILPGFDGQYGIVKIWDDKKVSEKNLDVKDQLGIDF
ncbi:MAG TPA: endonuclease Q family protein [Candidatus Sulfotelmatobacter sp.]|nr:endonuclease Q family protein [Candidatus Sulfotelmatobacter sp.]